MYIHTLQLVDVATGWSERVGRADVDVRDRGEYMLRLQPEREGPAARESTQPESDFWRRSDGEVCEFRSVFVTLHIRWRLRRCGLGRVKAA